MVKGSRRKNNRVKNLKKNENNQHESTKNKTRSLNDDTSSDELQSNVGVMKNELKINSSTNDVKKPKGLTNLGNTCFANSVLQVLSRTKLFVERLSEQTEQKTKVYRALTEKYLIKYAEKCLHDSETDEQSDNNEVDEEDDDNHDQEEDDDDQKKWLKLFIPPIKTNCITVALHNCLCEMNSKNQSPIVTPSSVINTVSAKYSQFKGRQQQDSHEFLRCLLDAIKYQEIYRQRKSLIDELKIEIRKDRNYDEETKSLVRKYNSNFTFIDETFSGVLLSSIKCEGCECISQHFEPFYDLSLAISEDKRQRKCPRNRKENRDENNSCEDNDISTNETSPSKKIDRKGKRQLKKAAKREARMQRKAAKVNKQQANNQTNEKENNDDEQNDINDDDRNDDEKPISLNDDDEIVNTTEVENEETIFDDVDDIAQPVDYNTNLINDDLYRDIKKLNLENLDECGDIASDSSTKAFKGNESDDDDNVDSHNRHSSASSLTPRMNGDNDADDELISDDDKPISSLISQLDSVELNNELNEPDENSELCESTNDSNELRKPRVRTISSSMNEKCNQEKIKLSLTAIASKSIEPGTDSLESCLASFTAPELLYGANKLICENCGKAYKEKTGITKNIYTNASKHTIIAFPPPILTIHLKRFELDGFNLRKISKRITFSVTIDLSPFVSTLYFPLSKILGAKESKQTSIKYNLYGIVEHIGSLRSGHYTAYVFVNDACETNKNITRLAPFINNVDLLIEKIKISQLKTVHQNSSNINDNQKSNDNTTDKEQSEAKATVNNESSSTNDINVNGNQTPKQRTGRWYHCSDTHVSETCLNNVLQSQPYLLFYERVD